VAAFFRKKKKTTPSFSVIVTDVKKETGALKRVKHKANTFGA